MLYIIPRDGIVDENEPSIFLYIVSSVGGCIVCQKIVNKVKKKKNSRQVLSYESNEHKLLYYRMESTNKTFDANFVNYRKWIFDWPNQIQFAKD